MPLCSALHLLNPTHALTEFVACMYSDLKYSRLNIIEKYQDWNLVLIVTIINLFQQALSIKFR